MDAINKHLNKDKKLAAIIRSSSLPVLRPKPNLYLELVEAIVSQQLSTKVAQVFIRRFYALFPTPAPCPNDILKLKVEVLRSIGLSNSKANYVRNVCLFFEEQQITDQDIFKLSNDEVIALLTQIKGVGRWTVQMILMFSLCRNDVFPEDDFGIRKAVSQIYGVDITDKGAMKQQMDLLNRRWSPYQSYACRYLWRSLDAV
jgi:DNA-3-methyladenine glycosylase II